MISEGIFSVSKDGKYTVMTGFDDEKSLHQPGGKQNIYFGNLENGSWIKMQDSDGWSVSGAVISPDAKHIAVFSNKIDGNDKSGVHIRVFRITPQELP